MWNYPFANPRLIYLLAILPLLIVFYVLRQSKRTAGVQISSLSFFSHQGVPFRLILRHILFGVQVVAIGLLIVALARPQSTESWSETQTEGIDITLCMDVSGSMRAMDFKPNRLEAEKDVAAEFVNGRPNDRFAVVAFSAESFTMCPLTSDRAVVVQQIDNLKFGMLEDGTAIGLGLATSVNRLKESKARSKVIILLTDGVNNAGSIGPLTAAEIAKEYGIRVYTIGVGSEGTAPIPVQTIFGQQVQQMKVEIDEEVLQKVADMTGGKYFRATDKEKLEEIYGEIDNMEKTILDTRNYSKRKEEYFPFLLLGVVLLAFETVVRYAVLKSIP
ncbi:MAG TPA: VWA domain-containing protein [Bacteroidales bacterium]|nr:VWA domain-containing protein [Bacteroidales bacterium]